MDKVELTDREQVDEGIARLTKLRRQNLVILFDEQFAGCPLNKGLLYDIQMIALRDELVKEELKAFNGLCVAIVQDRKRRIAYNATFGIMHHHPELAFSTSIDEDDDAIQAFFTHIIDMIVDDDHHLYINHLNIIKMQHLTTKLVATFT